MKGRLIPVLSLFMFLSLWAYIVRIYPVEVKAVNSHPVHNIDTGLDYTTIQEGINANETLNGHTIFVEYGTYYEHVVINKSLSLIGEDREETIIEGNGTRRGISIQRSNVSVSGFTVKNFLDGISAGIRSRIVREVVIDGNIISNSQRGIDLLGASPWSSIYGDHHLVKNNIVENNTYGIRLQGCFNVTICRNEVENNTENGIELNRAPDQPSEVLGSYYNLIVGNTIADNGLGVFLAGRDNVFYHNNFIDNQNQVEIYQDAIMDNDWSLDHPECGNYWSNFTGADGDHDGIGDAVHVLDANNTDYYPLMGMFYGFEVFLLPYPSGGSEYVTVVSNSAVEDLDLLVWLSSPNQYLQPGQEFLSFYASGEDGTGGFCRVMIPRTVLNSSSYTVLVDWNPVDVTELQDSNSTHAYLYFTYQHSGREIMIIPEFPSLIIPPLFVIAALTALICYRRKLT